MGRSGQLVIILGATAPAYDDTVEYDAVPAFRPATLELGMHQHVADLVRGHAAAAVALERELDVLPTRRDWARSHARFRRCNHVRQSIGPL